MPGIFISYRRSDNPDATGRIYDRLVAGFGRARVFKDVDAIPLGQDFRGHLNEVIGNCAVVIAIIGPRWTDMRDAAGNRRLEDPDDFVRIELEAALARNVPLLPVLVGHASMPSTRDLPATLSSIAFRQALEVRPDPDFHNDATRLVEALRHILDPEQSTEDPEHLPSPPGKGMARGPWLIAAAAGIALAALAIPAAKFLSQSAQPEFRADIVTPVTERPLDFALSSDGRQLAFVAKGDGVSRLWIRTLDSSAARPLPGTEGAMLPFWSPDGRSLGFFTSTTLKRLDLGGGKPRVITPMSSLNPGGGSWNSEGVILFSPSLSSALWSVPAAGGKATPVTQLQSAQIGHFYPEFLPDGRTFLFYGGGTPLQQGIFVGRLDGTAPVRVIESTSVAAYHPAGWLILGHRGSLVAWRFDPEKASLAGDPVALGVDYPEANVQGVRVSVSGNGLIAHRSVGSRIRQLQWLDRSGELRGTFGEPDATYSNPRISPDGQRIAIDRTVAGNTDIWVLDGTRSTRLTFHAQVDARPLWTPDGRDILFYSLRTGRMDLYRKASDGAGADSRLLQGEPDEERLRVATSISPDGRYVLFFGGASGASAMDIQLASLEAPSRPMMWLQTPFNEFWGVFSPDGRWIAYVSDESGQNEIYIRPFSPPQNSAGAAAPRSQWQISAAGGSSPQWRRDGRELYFLSPTGDLMAAAIHSNGSSLSPGAPVKLFAAQVYGGGTEIAQGRQYDVAADGRFLVNRQLEVDQAPPIGLIQNWDPDQQATR